MDCTILFTTGSFEVLTRCMLSSILSITSIIIIFNLFVSELAGLCSSWNTTVIRVWLVMPMSLLIWQYLFIYLKDPAVIFMC